MKRQVFDGYIADIGIECHLQLKTDSKLFCACSNDSRDKPPNSNVCPVCLGLPGTLPVVNSRAVELAIQAGRVLEAEIAEDTKFDRKNYFYPDLPKGYQITQYDEPIILKGEIEVPLEGEIFKVGITRAHLEEDAGKLIHPEGSNYTLVDLNRAGSPLLEIVSEPDMHTPSQAKAYAQELYHRMRYAGVSDVDLYHGNMRFDLNISVRPLNSKTLGTRTETKNLNSFRSVERAADFEIKRQIKLLENGQRINQETRGWNERETYTMRSKEEAEDYRYFPEPDIPPIFITSKIKENALSSLPPLLTDIRDSFVKNGISQTQVEAIINEPKLAAIQLDIIEMDPGQKPVTVSANWLSGEVLRSVRSEDFNWDEFKLDAQRLLDLAAMVNAEHLSSTAAKQVLTKMIKTNESPQTIAENESLLQVSDSREIEKIVEQVIKDNPQAVDDIRSGEQQAIGFLVGQVMKASGGQANPKLVQAALRERLKDV